jgi:hypothetical protein
MGRHVLELGQSNVDEDRDASREQRISIRPAFPSGVSDYAPERVRCMDKDMHRTGAERL